MHKLKQIIFILFCTISLCGCELTEREKFMLDQARQAFLSGEFQRSFDNLKLAYETRKDKTAMSVLPNNSITRQFLVQSTEAMQLASCIVMDMLNMVEANFGQPGRDFKIQMQNIMKEIEKFKPNLSHLSPDGQAQYPEGLNQEQLELFVQAQYIAKQHAAQIKQVRDCLSVNREYTLLKKEVGQMINHFGLTTYQQDFVQDTARQNFYHDYLHNYSTEYLRQKKTQVSSPGYQYQNLD